MHMTPARIVIAYTVVAGAWILLSDAAVALLPLPADVAAEVSVVKGLGFVAVTATILYALVRRLVRDIRVERGAALQAEARLGEVATSLSLALAAQDAVLGATAETGLLGAICEALVGDPRICCAWFGLARPGGSVEIVARAGEDGGYLEDLAVRWDDDPRGRGPTGTAIRSGRAVVVDDLATDERVGPWRPRMLAAGFGSSAAVPVAHDGTPLGVLNVYAVAKGAFSGPALADLERVGSEAGYALRAIRTGRERDAAARQEREASRRASAEAQRYARLVAESPLSIVVTDLDATVLEWNPAAERLWGLPADRAIGTFAPWILPDERPAYLDLVRRVADGFRPSGAIRARHRADGQEVVVRVANAPIADADGAVRILSISEDVSDQVRSERDLQLALARLEALHELDRAILGAATTDEICAAAAARVRRLVGAERVTVVLYDLAAGMARLAAADDAAGSGPAVGNSAPLTMAVPAFLIDQRTAVLVPATHPGIAGHPLAAPAIARGLFWMGYAPLVHDGELVGALSLQTTADRPFGPDAMDIAQEVAQQLAIALRQARYRDDLAEREARIRAILEGSPDAIVTVSSDLAVRYANPAASRAFGSGGVLAGRRVTDLVATDARSVFRDHVARVLGDQATTPVARLSAVDALRADGTTFPAAVEVAPLRGAPDAAAVVTVHDLSERVALETRLAQAQRVETLGRFAGILAHDLRSYVTAIDWSATALAADLPADDPRQADVRLIATAVAEAREFLGSVLEFARPGTQGGSTDLGGHVARMGGILARLLGPDVRLEVDVPLDLPAVRLGPAAVTQVLVNLATNARDAMPDGGSFTIVARAREVGPTAADVGLPTAGGSGARDDQALPPGPYVRLEVADTGIGMDREAAGAAFQAFYTTKSDATAEVGTGLGLASVHLLVVRAGGEIAVESEPERGTRFVIDLPVADRPSRARGTIGAPAGE